MPNLASLVLLAVSVMTVQGVKGLMRYPHASSKEKEATLERGKMLVKVERMVPFLKRYPNREAAPVFQLGFS